MVQALLRKRRGELVVAVGESDNLVKANLVRDWLAGADVFFAKHAHLYAIIARCPARLSV